MAKYPHGLNIEITRDYAVGTLKTELLDKIMWETG